MAQNEDRPIVDTPIQIVDTGKSDTPQAKTIILWGRENLLGSVVRNLLDSLKMRRVVCLSDDLDESTAIREIKNLNPDALIVYRNEDLVEIQMLIHLLDECPGLKIITVSPQSNSIQIYNKQRVWIKNSEDFLAMMEE